jgi:hypothetical protein
MVSDQTSNLVCFPCLKLTETAQAGPEMPLRVIEGESG